MGPPTRSKSAGWIGEGGGDEKMPDVVGGTRGMPIDSFSSSSSIQTATLCFHEKSQEEGGTRRIFEEEWPGHAWIRAQTTKKVVRSTSSTILLGSTTVYI